ncbi:cyclohexyl-isocyanide hydratase [Orenia metallireducens]|uniref:Cyclohexyl-isocyanide hydratase n=1 Tax=Orenia metallireducens TaxID=1413210 RepID=A0A285I6L9_9FIRM|nr:DJ-1/PfpI family protein [Orenia metallireducens]PRX22467.1 cyclohexyl-isocyanide hydratase [Orenia metallireducens]SNY43609.1 cyclohexyl-isocyanide hydratase [Orenia metallireducens]
MKVAFVIFKGMTALDLIGIYDPLVRLKTMGFIPELEWEICSYSQQEINEFTGLKFTATKTAVDLSNFDLVIIPGGFGTRTLIKDTNFLEWIKTAKGCDLIVSVCTGSLLLGAAGLLQDKKATTHPNAFTELEGYCQEVLCQRIIDEGNIITARGVTSSIDLGLYLCEKLAGYEVKEKIRKQMDYKN